jgi:A/G-specific adenine glycosylase
MKTKFTSLLMQWHKNINQRVMPWKGEKDPYKIWLSEVILQQTRVEQGWAYYEKFIKTYPAIEQLAKAKDEDVFKLWEGLGYYNRCKNLLFTARYISKNCEGKFPQQHEEIIALKGIGPYTAAAISSFAFNLPHAVVDGNVFRVLSRVFGIETAIDSTKGKAEFTALAQKVLDKNEPGLYNQAIMDFGATVCKPVSPLCNTCLMQKNCAAFKKGKVNQLPFKEKMLQKKHRWFYYFMMEHDGKVLLHKRTAQDIWENLFEFYLLESNEQIQWDKDSVTKWFYEQFALKTLTVEEISVQYLQQLTHQQIKGSFIKIKLKKIPPSLQSYSWLPIKKIKTLAFPKFINQYLAHNSF